MYRSDTEIKLLKIRQGLLDALRALRDGSKVVPLQQYRRVMVQFMVCEELLSECRREYLYGNLRRTR